MLISRLQEIIDDLSLKESSLDPKDLDLQQLLEIHKPLNLELQESDKQWLHVLLNEHRKSLADPFDSDSNHLKSQNIKPSWQLLINTLGGEVICLSELLSQLQLSQTSSLLSKLKFLQEEVKTIDKIEGLFLENLIGFCKDRGMEVIDTGEDYTRLDGGANIIWILLAQFLSNTDHFEDNYYKLLIPTLTHNEEFVTKEPLTAYALTNFIISDDGSELIFLSTCANHYKYDGTFNNCNHSPVRQFTEKEQNRMSYTSGLFLPYIACFTEESREPPISKKTVEAIKELCDKSIFSIGLLANKDYTALQLESADAAYEKFFNYTLELSKEEHSALFNQKIYFNQKSYKKQRYKTLAEIMGYLYNGSCAAVKGQYLMQLVFDYDKYAKFSDELESRADTDMMRRCSLKKVYSDYDYLDFGEAKRRLLITFASMMTHSYKMVLGSGVSISIWDTSNKVTTTCKKIYKLLKPMMNDGYSDDARFLYVSLVNGIIESALRDNGYMVMLKRSKDTYAWLKSIIDCSLFDKEKSVYFAPSVILAGLYPEIKNASDKLKTSIELFLDEVVNTLLQDKNENLKWVRINIKFSGFLKSLDVCSQNQILGKLRKVNVQKAQECEVKNVKDFIVYRMISWLLENSSNKSSSFFKPQIQLDFKRAINANFNLENEKNQLSINGLMGIMKECLSHLVKQVEHNQMNLYLDHLMKKIPELNDNHAVKYEVQMCP